MNHANSAGRSAWLLLLLGVLLRGSEAPLTPDAARIEGDVLHANTLEVAGLAFRDVNAYPQYADGKLTFANIEAKAYRGRVTGRYAIQLAGARVHHCRFDVAGLDLAVMARSLGATTEQLGGDVDGWLQLTIPVGDPDGLRGRGEATVTKGTLVQLPFLVNLLTGNPTAARGKDNLTVRYEIHDRKVHVLFARLDSPVVQLAMEGWIGFDGSLNLVVAPRLPFSVINKAPLIGPWLAGGLSRLAGRVGRAYVRGHVSQPVITINPFGE